MFPMKRKVRSMNEQTKKLYDQLSPEWIRECAMVESKQGNHTLVISPLHCRKHGITNVKISQNTFEGRTIAQFRLDFDLRKVKDYSVESVQSDKKESKTDGS